MHRRQAVALALALLAAFAAWALAAPWLAGRLVVARPLERADAILVLGGSADYRPRAEEAALLYKAGVARRVLLTNDGELAGWFAREQRTPPFVELSKRRLIALGVPESGIEILSPQVSGTFAEARLLGERAAQKRWNALLIVTSAYHTRRALGTFEKEFAARGLATRIGIVPALQGRGAPPRRSWWLTPSGWRDVAGEYVKGAWYGLAY